MKDLHILVCCHKPDKVVDQPPYYPIHVGKAQSACQLPYHGDNEGEHISQKNPTYCECTGLYWAWKNLHDVKAVGLCHYRRYFDFHGQGRAGVPYSVFPAAQIDALRYDVPAEVADKVIKGDTVVLAQPEYVPFTLAQHYELCHNEQDWITLGQIIEECSGEKYARAFRNYGSKCCAFSPYNMFLMSRANFDRYCQWLFTILEAAERRIDISRYSPYQRRIFGFMAERLLNIWVMAEQKPTLYFPVMALGEGIPEPNPWKYRCYRLFGRWIALSQLPYQWRKRHRIVK